MSSLQNFWFEGKNVRFVGTADKPEWVAQDVCECLEISPTNISHALESLEEGEAGKKILLIRSENGVEQERELRTVFEPGLYRLVFKSRKAAAKRFQRWVFHDVLPQIRATGKYNHAKEQPKLPPHQEVREVAETIVYVHENLSDIDPRLAQILIDRAMQTVQPLLPSAEPTVKLAGAVEIAEGLGFSVGKEQSSLGKAVAKAWREAYETEPQEVKRECGGAMRKLKVYPSDDPVVVATIKEFYCDREVA